MRRKMLKRGDIVRKLRQFSVLIALLLVPLGAWAEEYPLWIGGEQVTDENAANVFAGNETNDGKVSYDSSTNTLTLDGIVLDEGGITYSGTNDLTITLSGESSINYVSLEQGESTSAPQLLFTKASGATDCSLHLDSNGDGSVISGFASVDFGTLNTVSPTPWSYGGIGPEAEYIYLLNPLEEDDAISEFTITSAPAYPIWVAGTQVTGASVEGENIVRNVEDGEWGVTYDSSSNTLTLKNVNIYTNENNPTQMIMSNGALNIALEGDNYISFNGDYSSYVFKNVGSSGGLTISANGDGGSLGMTTGYYDGSYYGLCDGYGTPTFNNNLGFIRRSGSGSIEDVSQHAPTFYEAGDNVYYVQTDGLLKGATYYYKVDYVDETLQDSEVQLPVDDEDNWSTDYSFNASELLGPCTITVYTLYNGSTVASRKAKLFGAASLRLVYGGEAELTLTPALEEGDGIQVSGIEANYVSYNSETNKLTGTGIGAESFPVPLAYTNEYGQYTGDGTLLLNTTNLGMQVEVAPAAPTINVDPTKTYLDTDRVTVSVDESLSQQPSVNVYYSWNPDCDFNNGNSYGADGVPLTAGIGTKTLYAWVMVNRVYSDKTSHEIDIKADISSYALRDASITSAAYTGSAITPTFTVCDAKDETNVIAASNYDVKYEEIVVQMGAEAGVTYEEVESMVNVGTYRVTIAGKGSFGGEKTVFESFQVTPAATTITFAEESYVAVYDSVFTAPTPEGGLTVTATASSNTDVATVSNGSISLVGVGETTISVSYAGDENHSSATGEYLLVVNRKNIATFTVSVDAAQGYTFTGDSIKPAVSIHYADGSTLEAKNYNLRYENCVNAGQATAIVSGIGNYTGTASATFTIAKANLTDVSVVIADWAYGAEGSEAQVSGNVGEGVVTFTYKAEDGAAFSTAKPTEIGNYVVKATIAETDNYNEAEATAAFTIYGKLDIEFAEGQIWATYCSAVDLTVPEGLTAYTVSGVDAASGTVSIEQIDYLPADQAVLLERSDEGETTESFIALPYTGETTEVTNLLQGSSESVGVESIQGGAVYILYNNVFRRATNGTIPASRGYLVVNAVGQSRMLIVHGGTETAIGATGLDSDAEMWYGVDGRKLNGQPRKAGLYIKNGKKVYVNNK